MCSRSSVFLETVRDTASAKPQDEKPLGPSLTEPQTIRLTGKPFFGSRQPTRSFREGEGDEGENCVFFERAIFHQFWSSTAPALRFLAVSRVFLAPVRPPVHFGELELT